jgi:succinate dehydrogenase/fumarate reductase flavoprotein subunit
MAAAAAAAVNGADVTVLEAAGHLGGTTATSGAGMWIPANPWAAAHGVQDSPEEAVRYLRAISSDGTDPAIPEAFVAEGTRVTKAIEAGTPIRWSHLVEFSDYHAELDGGSVHGRSIEMQLTQVPTDVVAMVRTSPYGTANMTIMEEEVNGPPDADEIARREREGLVARGRGMVAAFAATVLEHGGTIRRGARATSVLTDGDAVTGVVVDGEELRGQVVVASGGFERNPEFVSAFLRGPMLAPAGPPSNRGDGIVMAMQAGAALGNMSDAWWVAGLQVPGETIDGVPFYRMLFVESARPGGIAVDAHGRRFVNESVNYYSFGRSLQERDANTYEHARVPAWLIFDAGRRVSHPIGPLNGSSPDPDWLPRADTLAGLAERIGLPPAALEETVATYNAGVENGTDAFGRGSYIWDAYSTGGAPLRPVAEAPFYALKLLPGCSGTKGGLATDAQARVRRRDGDGVVAGLFAAGNASAYPFGQGYPGPGATVGPGVVFGWLAGEHAAAG